MYTKTTDRINFNYLPENSRIALIDMVGRTFVVKNAAELKSSMSLQPFDKGMYLIQVMDGVNIIQSAKVLKK
jgi:hypothetical protein